MKPASQRALWIERIALCLAGVVVASHTAESSGQTAPLSFHAVRYELDSGLVAAAGTGGVGQQPVAVWLHEVSVPDADWVRLYFDASTSIAPGAQMVITSMLDGEQQVLDGVSIAEWSNSSAYFNGDTVQIELFARPGEPPSRVRLDHADAGSTVVQEDICGSTDDRVPRNFGEVSRLVPVGCTSWTISNYGRANQFLTAGHCVTNGQIGLVVQYNVPPSNANGSVNHPPIASQFAVDPASIQSTGDNGPGDDAATMNTFPNSNTRLEARVAHHDYAITLGVPPTSPNFARVIGYGTTDGTLAPLTWNEMGKEHFGPYLGVFGDKIAHEVDSTGGNSGSPILVNGVGVGIHTHGGCASLFGTNEGTASTDDELNDFLDSPQGYQAPYDVNAQRTLYTLNAANDSGAPGGAVYFDVQTLTNNPLRVNGLFANIANAGQIALLDDYFTCEVYITPGSCVGKELDMAQWTKVANGYGMPNPQGLSTNVALYSPFVLAPFSSYGMAIVFDSAAAHAYTIGNGSNQTYQNSVLKITGRSATNAKFSNNGQPAISPRVFNGALCTTVLPPQGRCEETYFWSTDFTPNDAMVYFDLDTTSQPIDIYGLDTNVFTTGLPVTCEIYTANGTRSGKHATPGAWTLRAIGTGISAGLNQATHLSLSDVISIPANTTRGFAIKVSVAGSVYGAELSNVSPRFASPVSTPDFLLYFGEASNTSFTAPSKENVIWNGRICYSTNASPTCGQSPASTTRFPFNAQMSSSNSNTGLGGVSTQQVAQAWSVPDPWSFTQLRAYGIYTGSFQVPPAQNFVVNMYNNHPTISRPGALNSSVTIPNVVPKDTGGFATGTGLPFGLRVYSFDLNFPVPFEASAHTTYWLSVLGDSPGATWSWQRSSTLGAYAERATATGSWSFLPLSGSFTWIMCGQPLTTPCYADCDFNGALNIFDYICFGNAYASQDPYADCDSNSTFNIFDYICFGNAYAAGCP